MKKSLRTWLIVGTFLLGACSAATDGSSSGEQASPTDEQDVGFEGGKSDGIGTDKGGDTGDAEAEADTGCDAGDGGQADAGVEADAQAVPLLEVVSQVTTERKGKPVIENTSKGLALVHYVVTDPFRPNAESTIYATFVDAETLELYNEIEAPGGETELRRTDHLQNTTILEVGDDLLMLYSSWVGNPRTYQSFASCSSSFYDPDLGGFNPNLWRHFDYETCRNPAFATDGEHLAILKGEGQGVYFDAYSPDADPVEYASSHISLENFTFANGLEDANGLALAWSPTAGRYVATIPQCVIGEVDQGCDVITTTLHPTDNPTVVSPSSDAPIITEADGPLNLADPELLWNDDGFGLVFINQHGGGHDLWLKPLDAYGEAAGAQVKLSASPRGYDATWTGSHYAVVTAVEDGVHLRLYERDGTEAAHIEVAEGWDPHQAAVSTTDRGFVVAWQDGHRRVKLARVDATF